MSKNTRLITIETRGPIYQKAGIIGPITVPYQEKVETIARMIIGRVAVTEHLQDGVKRKLTVKDIPELTAESPKVLKPNQLQQKEKNDVQKLIDEAKAATKVEEAPVVEPVTVEAVDTNTDGVDVSAMTKKERKAFYEQQRAEKAAVEAAANQPIEDGLEAK